MTQASDDQHDHEQRGVETPSDSQVTAGRVVSALENNTIATRESAKFWKRVAVVMAILFSISTVANTVGWISLFQVVNGTDLKQSNRTLAQTVDCNSRQAIEDALNQLYKQNNRPYTLNIKCKEGTQP